MTRIAIVTGTTRPGRKALTVAEWVREQAQSYASGVQDAVNAADPPTFEVVDLAGQALPLLDEPVPASLGDYQREHTRAWAEVVDSYDGFVFVTPEYNHGIPAALKNALDFVYAEWNNKAAGIVSYGANGGTRAAEQLRLVLAELQVADVRSQVCLSIFQDFHDGGGLRPGGHQVSALHGMLDQLLDWSRALHGLRAAS